jgi:hypothetical protein
MPIIDIVIAPIAEAVNVGESLSVDDWENTDVSIFGFEGILTLVGNLKDQNFSTTLNSIPDVGPQSPEDAEPWDESAWVTPVFHLIDDYVKTIVSISDAELSAVGTKWYTDECFESNREHVDDFTEDFVIEQLKEIRDFLAVNSGSDVLIRCGM